MGFLSRFRGGSVEADEGPQVDDASTPTTRYGYLLHYVDGVIDDDDDELFDTYDEAMEAGLYGLSCAAQGAEVLHLPNPGDYPFDEDDPPSGDVEVIEVQV